MNCILIAGRCSASSRPEASIGRATPTEKGCYKHATVNRHPIEVTAKKVYYLEKKSNTTKQKNYTEKHGIQKAQCTVEKEENDYKQH